MIVNLALEAFLDPGDRLFVRQLPVHESAAAGLLHNLGTIIARDFAKAFVAIDNREVDDLSVRQEKTAVRLTAAPSYDVLEECVLRGDQAPAPPWHPFFLE